MLLGKQKGCVWGRLALSESLLSEIKIWAANFAPRDFLYCNGQPVSTAEYTALYSLIGTAFGGDGRVTFNLPDLRARVPCGSMQMGPPPPPLEGLPRGMIKGNQSVPIGIDNMPAHSHKAVGQSSAVSAYFYASGLVQDTVAPANLTARPTVNQRLGTKDYPDDGDLIAVTRQNTFTTTPYFGYTDTSGTPNRVQLEEIAVTGDVTVPGQIIDVSGTANVPSAHVDIGIDSTGGGLALNIDNPALGLDYIICVDGIYPPRP
ncbi:MAG: hypothetical protein CL557_10425 [Alphaproteobacteria bacterium]|nr:hypothetical protein [Alphaproteobacteria bacterium]MAX96983.1 hypothetical protein [Alphaproteobacteria bacterium]